VVRGFRRDGRHRLLVAEEDSRAVGYASSREFRSKAAYARTVETTIYLAAERTGRSLGRELYGALLDLMRAEPEVHRAVAGITLPNAASLALHEKLGFEPMGTFHEVGFKIGRYWDVQWFQRGMEIDAA
jgi:phosphinothricin acetyltransferase